MERSAQEDLHAPHDAWRRGLLALWVAAGGAPLGALGVLCFDPSPERTRLVQGCVAAGAGAALLVLWLSRGAPRARLSRLASAAAAGLFALPALGCVLLRVGPPAPAWWAVALSAWAGSLVLAVRGPWPSRAPSAPLAALATLALGAILAFAASWLWARGGASGVAHVGEPFRLAVLDLDARVALLPDPGCTPRARGAEVLAHGAHPRFDRQGTLWFDAAAPDGRRQIHRLRPGGVVECLTCRDRGNNQRPSPTRAGVFFDTDRFASPLDPTDTEVMWLGRSHLAPDAPVARRLTFRAGPDERPLADPWGAGTVWTRGIHGGFEVVHAGLERGHGGLALGVPRVLQRGGDHYVEALGWSADGRALLVSEGSGRSVGESWLRDLGVADAVPQPLVATASASFSADGIRLCAVGGRRAGALAAAFGFLLARLAPAANPAGESVLLGPRAGPLSPVDLADVSDFGRPTGVSLAPDGRAFALAQRAADGTERIVRVALACRS